MTIDTPNKTVTSDGSQADTQAAVDYVDGLNVDGWTIIIGTAGGSYTWSSAVKMADTFANSVTIQGAGGVNNKTRITANFSDGGAALGIICYPGKIVKVQYIIGIVTPGNTLGTGFCNVDQAAGGNTDIVNGFWIENCNFENCHTFGIGVLWPNTDKGNIYGLIDLCNFNINQTHNGIYVQGGNYGNAWGTGNRGSTNGTMTWGTVNTVCIEDCYFTFSGATIPGNPAIDSAYDGARWLSRHNTFTNWVCVAHGADSATSSTLQVEMLHNTFVITGSAVDYIMYLRGGSMRFWDNVVTLLSGASLNQIVKTANDSAATGGFEKFQQVGHGVTGGRGNPSGVNGETYVPCYTWGNNTPAGVTLFNPAAGINSGIHYFNLDPGDYVELQYPHPLRASGSAGTGIYIVRRYGPHIKFKAYSLY